MNIATALKAAGRPPATEREARAALHAPIWIGSQNLLKSSGRNLKETDPTAPPTPDAASTTPISTVDKSLECAWARSIRISACATSEVAAIRIIVTQARRSFLNHLNPWAVSLTN
jgi:hypothetical protein